jgi:hypothetical protein
MDRGKNNLSDLSDYSPLHIQHKVKTSLRTPQKYWPVEVKLHMYFQYGSVLDKEALALQDSSKISFHQFFTFKDFRSPLTLPNVSTTQSL